MYNKMSTVTKTLIIITGAHHEVESPYRGENMSRPFRTQAHHGRGQHN